MQQRTKRIYASILFLDIVGFTDFSEKSDPEVVDDILSFFFDFCSNEIKKNNGWVEKYIGDAICAIFYSSISSFKDALNACNCAFNILKKAKVFNREGKFPFSIRIGIDSGVVTTTKREQYDVFVGQAINSAARIQSVAMPDSCYVSTAIYRKTKNIFTFEDIGEFGLKGITEKAKLYLLKDKKDIFSVEKNLSSYFPRKEEVKLIKLITDNKKIKIALIGLQGSGKTYFSFKIAQYLNQLYDYQSIYICLNDWDKTNDDLVEKINFFIDFNGGEKNKLKLLIIDNFNSIIDKYEALKFIQSLNFIDSTIINYTIEEEENDKLKDILSSFKYEILYIDKLTYDEFGEFIRSYFNKAVAASFELKLYNLSDGFIGRAYNFLSILKDEFQLNLNQIVNIDFEELFSKNQDLLEHCYRINGIDEKMQMLLSIIAFSYKPLNENQLGLVCEKLNYLDFQDFLNKAYKKNWIKFDDRFYKINNEYLKQFIINSTSNQLKNRILEILLYLSEKILDKITYLIDLYNENNNIFINEDDFLSKCFHELENEQLDQKLLLLKKLVKKFDVTFFKKIIKFILLDIRIYPYLLNIFKKDEIKMLANYYSDLKQIHGLSSISDIFFDNFNQAKIEKIKSDKNIEFYLNIINYLIYPKSVCKNLESYKNFKNLININTITNNDYLYLFNFPSEQIEISDHIEKLNKLFNDNFSFYNEFERIYLNSSFLFLNKIQLLFLIIENISLYLYFKKKPINHILSLLNLCEKIVLELNSPILIEYYYGLFFYTQFVLLNFQYYGLHNKMEFNNLPQLKQINEIIYYLYSFSFNFKNELIKENKFLENALKDFKNLLQNPPYYIPLSVSHWYYFLILNGFDDELIKIRENIIKIKSEYSLNKNNKSNQIAEFEKIIFSLI